ncbi:MAG TPA: TetR family transcriptional regulator [Kofleriaceae bacterium]|nr:TetR family transcriptional regulator [Kofleriaceae bacterium]
MARWEPDARGRLEKAAMDLFIERGYERTTVSDIAARADLTERTFFRYFADKREVLFSGSRDLERTIVDHIAAAPPDLPPLDVLVAAYAAAGAWLEALRDLEYVRARYALITKHAELRERELIKLAGLAGATSAALIARGVPEATAGLAAELGLAVFKRGFERWVTSRKPRDVAGHIRAALADVRGVVAAAPARPR